MRRLLVAVVALGIDRRADQRLLGARAELDRRLDAYEIDKNPGRPAADVVADIRQRL